MQYLGAGLSASHQQFRWWVREKGTKMNDPTKTADGVLMEPDLRVFTNDWCWGTVIEGRVHVEVNQNNGAESHWHHVRLDSGATKTYDGSRLATRKPL
jgi:hypothetical protein